MIQLSSEVPSEEPCFFANADDWQRNIVPANFFADGINAGKKIVDDVHADDANGSGGVQDRLR